MKRLLCLGILLFVGPAVLADDADEARKIIDKGIKAAGLEPRATPKATTQKGKGIFYGMGDGVPYEGSWAWQYPDKSRMEIQMAFIRVFNGDTGWVSAGGNTNEMNKDQLAEQKELIHGHYVTELTPLTEKDFTLKTIGEGKVDDKATVGVMVSQKGRRDITLHFDKDSGLLVKVEQIVKDDQSGQEAKEETVIKEYMKVGDKKVPGKFLVTRDGKKFVDHEVTEYKVHDKLPDGTFDKP